MSDWTVYHHPQIFQGHLCPGQDCEHTGLYPEVLELLGLLPWTAGTGGNVWVGEGMPVFVCLAGFFPSSENQRAGLIASPFQPAGTHRCINTAPCFSHLAAPLQSLSSAQMILLTNKFQSFSCFLSHRFSFQSASKDDWKNCVLFAISLCCCWN